MSSTTTTPTAPLSAPAADALSRLERAFADRSVNDVLAREASMHVRRTAAIERAVTRYGICLARVAELTMMDARRMSPAEFDALADAQNELTRLHEQLEAAGQLHLVVAS